MSRIQEINAESNQIADLNLVRLKGLPHLKQINMKENPLRPATREAVVYGDLKFEVQMSDVEDSDDYEDMDWLIDWLIPWMIDCFMIMPWRT